MKKNYPRNKTHTDQHSDYDFFMTSASVLFLLLFSLLRKIKSEVLCLSRLKSTARGIGSPETAVTTATVLSQPILGLFDPLDISVWETNKQHREVWWV